MSGRRAVRHGITLAAALGAAVVLTACANGSTGQSGTGATSSSTTRSTTPAQALASLESTLRTLENATLTLRTTLVSMEGAALTGSRVSASDVESATAPVTQLLEQASTELETAKRALPADLAPQVSSLEGALAKSRIDFSATKAMAGAVSSTPGTGAAAVAPSAGLSAFINAYLTDVTELVTSEQGAVTQFLASVGAPTR